MLTSIGKERIFHHFLNGSAPEFSRFIGRPTVRRGDVTSRFGIQNFMGAMAESLHWAEWRAVGIEHQLAGGGVDRKIGFDIDVGRGEGHVRMRYFPLIPVPRHDYPLQFASLYVSGGIPDTSRGIESLYNVPAIIKSVEVIGRSIKFTGSIPTTRHTFPVLWIEPTDEHNGDFQFRLGERILPPGKLRPRRGFSDNVMLPGLAMEPDEGVLVFEQPTTGNFL